jgi:glycosyltransferase 2 family protein
MNKPLKITLGVAVSSCCLWLAFRGISFADVGLALQTAVWFWFIPVFFITLLAHALRTVRWKILLSPLKNIPAPKLFMILTLGFFMNNILPARAGELIRAVALDKETGIPTSSGLGSVALERLTDLIGLMFVLTMASTIIPADKVPLEKVALMLVIGAAGVAALYFVFQRWKPADAAGKPGPVRWVLLFLKKLTSGFSVLKSPGKVTLVMFVSISIWALEVAGLLCMARVFSLTLSFAQSSAVLMGIAVGVMIPAAPGYVGTYEYFGKRMMMLLGFAEPISLSFILTLHVFQLTLNSLLGLPGFFKIGIAAKKE